MKRDEQADIEQVASGYDAVGDAYFQFYRAQVPEVVRRYERVFTDGVPGGGTVLELGCGNGLPVTANLAEKFDVTAVDVSQKQLEKARRNVPGARFMQADMSALEFHENSFDGVIALYSIIHVPSGRQPALIRSIYSWLRTGGLFVATFGARPGEHRDDDWFGASMYWSSFDADTNRRMVSEAGFVLESDRVEVTTEPEEERHLWIVARKPADA